MAIKLTLDVASSFQKLTRYFQRSQTNARTEIQRSLSLSGIHMVKSVDTNFRMSGRPAWKPLKASTIRRRRGGSNRPLMDTGRLRNSITMRRKGTDTVSVGTNVFYGKFHQKGTKNMVARPFLLFQKTDVTIIKKIFRDNIGRAFGLTLRS